MYENEIYFQDEKLIFCYANIISFLELNVCYFKAKRDLSASFSQEETRWMNCRGESSQKTSTLSASQENSVEDQSLFFHNLLRNMMENDEKMNKDIQ